MPLANSSSMNTAPVIQTSVQPSVGPSTAAGADNTAAEKSFGFGINEPLGEPLGSAKGLSPATMGEVYGQIVRWAQAGTLTFDLEKVPLSQIEAAWQRTDLRGRRLVVVP